MTESPLKSVVIGTAGHIDHGKTALVHALTGTDTDRLPEEKRRGITIDLGFASFETSGPDGIPLRLSFVDVPGHHAFIRNMLAGAGGVDCVLLVVSAEEGIKPQTEEHLAICTLLGIARGFTVLTKADVVSADRLQQVHEEVAQWLKGSFLHMAPILPVSAFTGQGMPELKTELARLAAQIPERSAEALPRLPLDRAFSIRGFGTVVTGTLQAGAIHTGETLALQPGDRRVRVRGMQVHGSEVSEAHAAARVALNLSGIEVAEARRGDTLVPAGTLAAVDAVDVELTLLPGVSALKHRSRVRLHAFTADALATVSLYAYQQTRPDGNIVARLRLAKPLLLLPGDRFVLRQCSPAVTIGGGRVLDAHPLPRLKKAQCLAWLEEVKDASPARQLLLRVSRRAHAGIDTATLITETGWKPEAIREIATPMLTNGVLVHSAPDYWITGEALSSAIHLAFDTVKSANGAAIRKSELRHHTRLNEQVFDCALDRLTGEQKLEIKGELVTLSGVAPQLPEIDRKRLAAIEQAYAAAGLSAPLLRDVAERLAIANTDLRRLLTLLLRDRKLIKLGSDDLYMHADALETLHFQIRQLRGQSLDVARFKQITGLSRKYAIPLLEHLDREHITRKQGETRLVL